MAQGEFDLKGKIRPTLTVGIGASAGGLEPLRTVLSQLPSAEGLAVIVVLHLDSHVKSLLSEVLQASAHMPIAPREDGLSIEANRIYVIPGHSLVELDDGVLRLREAASAIDRRIVIDRFLIALAQDQRERAVAVTLSGAGIDGSVGLKAVAGAGGLTMVQKPNSAAHPNMPQASIDTGMVDYVLPPSELAAQLLTYLLKCQLAKGNSGED